MEKTPIVKPKANFTEWLFQIAIKTKEETDPVFKLAQKFQYDISWNVELTQLEEVIQHVLLESIIKGFKPQFIKGACMRQFMKVDEDAIVKCYQQLAEKTSFETMAIAYTCKLAWADYENYLKND